MALVLNRNFITATISKIFGTKSITNLRQKSPLYNRLESSVNQVVLIKEGKAKGRAAKEVLRDL